MMENEPSLEETSYYSFILAIRSPVTREKYLGRLGMFMSYVGITEGNLEEKCNALGEKVKANPTWLTREVIRYLHIHMQRAEKREISGATLRNYLKPIKLFCEQLEISLPWKRITRGLPKGRRYANDGVPTIEEIKKIVQYPDRRIKPIVCIMGTQFRILNSLSKGSASKIESVLFILSIVSHHQSYFCTEFLISWSQLNEI
ncbi:hypothetical protein BH18THE1_BH18THE1_20790 [soil metagenome]